MVVVSTLLFYEAAAPAHMLDGRNAMPPGHEPLTLLGHLKTAPALVTQRTAASMRCCESHVSIAEAPNSAVSAALKSVSWKDLVSARG